MNGDRHTLAEYELEVGQCWEAVGSAGGGGCSYLNFNLVRLDRHLCLFRRPTAANACDQSLPCNNTRITCHSDSSINSQLISPRSRMYRTMTALEFQAFVHLQIRTQAGAVI